MVMQRPTPARNSNGDKVLATRRQLDKLPALAEYSPVAPGGEETDQATPENVSPFVAAGNALIAAGVPADEVDAIRSMAARQERLEQIESQNTGE